MTAPRVGRFVDAEKLTYLWLTSRVDPATTRVVTKLPAKITGRILWVIGVGGPDNGENALLRVDVQSLAPARPDSSDDVWDLAGEAHDHMAALGGQTVAVVMAGETVRQAVNNVAVGAYPVSRPYSDTVDRVVASYDLDVPTLP